MGEEEEEKVECIIQLSSAFRKVHHRTNLPAFCSLLSSTSNWLSTRHLVFQCFCRPKSSNLPNAKVQPLSSVPQQLNLTFPNQQTTKESNRRLGKIPSQHSQPAGECARTIYSSGSQPVGYYPFGVTYQISRRSDTHITIHNGSKITVMMLGVGHHNMSH